jgi:hypothetical protein
MASVASQRRAFLVALHVVQDGPATEKVPGSRPEHKIVCHFVPLSDGDMKQNRKLSGA